MKTSVREFNLFLLNCAESRGDITANLLPLRYNTQDSYWFVRLASAGIDKEDRTLLIRAGIHGNEMAGPLTLLGYFHEIVAYAHQRNVKLIIYPLGNPSGFAGRTRYNIENLGNGACGNNDFVRYRLKDGSLTDDLGDSDKFIGWYWSSNPALGLKLPRETLLMHDCLRQDQQTTNILGVLDLHQDYYTADVGPLAYHYAFGNLSRYGKIIEDLRKIIPVRSLKTAAGFSNGIAVQSDENGFIVRHDGTLTDLADHLGIEYNVTVETTGCTPLETAMKVNLIWIKEFVDLIADNR